MKSSRLIHSGLSLAISEMGHGDCLAIADAGLPIPPTTKRIDLAVMKGVPSFLEVLDAVLSELRVDHVLVAEEFSNVSPALYAKLTARLERYTKATGQAVRIQAVSHTEFKKATGSARAVARTGEFTPYANILLYSNVVF